MSDSMDANTIVQDKHGKQSLSIGGQLLISNFWFALQFLWSPIGIIMVADQVRIIDPVHKFNSLALVLSLGALMSTITQPLVGAMSDRTLSRFGPRRPYIFIGALLTCGSLFWMAWSGSVLLLVTGYLFMQLTSNIAGAAYQALIPDLVPVHQRGSASGWMSFMTLLGTISGVYICGSLLQDFHLRYYTIAGVIFCFMVLTLILVPVRHLDAQKIEPFKWSAFFAGFWINPRKHPDFFWVFFTRVLVALGFVTVLSFLNYYLLDVTHHGYATQQTVDNDVFFLSLALIIAAACTTLLGGMLSDLLGSRKIPVYIATLIQTVGLAIFLIHPSFSLLLVGAAFFGMGFGAYSSVDWALATDVLPTTSDNARNMGIWSIAGVIPQILAPIIHGPILQSLNTPAHPILGFDVIFLLAVVYYLFGALFVRNIRGVR